MLRVVFPGVHWSRQPDADQRSMFALLSEDSGCGWRRPFPCVAQELFVFYVFVFYFLLFYFYFAVSPSYAYRLRAVPNQKKKKEKEKEKE